MTRKGNLIWQPVSISYQPTTTLDNCITRLRLEVKDHTRVDETQIRSAGVAGVIRPSETAVQVVVGTKVQSIADELRKLLQ